RRRAGGPSNSSRAPRSGARAAPVPGSHCGSASWARADGTLLLRRPTPLPSAVPSLALGIGIVCARPDRGPASVITSADAGGVLARRLLPVVVIITVAARARMLGGQ